MDTYTIYDDTARQARVYSMQKVLQSSRAYTPEENAAADAAAAANVQQTNKGAIEANILSDLAAMQTIISDTNANINANPAARIKDIAQAIRRLDRMALQKFDGTT